MTREQLENLGKEFSWPFVRSLFYPANTLSLIPAEKRAWIERHMANGPDSCIYGYEEGFRNGVNHAIRAIGNAMGEQNIGKLLK